MEIDTAVRRMLLQEPTVDGYVVRKVFKNVLTDHIDGTGGRAIVVRRGNGWSPPARHHSSEYPTVVVECWADVDRDAAGMKRADNAIDKAFALQRAVSRAMHRKRDVWWGGGGLDRGVRVFTCLQSNEPSAETDKDMHGNVKIGDAAIVTVEFDLWIAP